MKGRMRRQPDGTLFCILKDKWGYVHHLTGTKADEGYDIEVVLKEIPEDLWLPGDEANFEVVRK